ncbi:hypothetical protein T45_00891 [Streptomyces turgidiscabies]|nr:hypothetical protein T45_00891 [Streptomyces turgidiscabies]
MLNSSPSSAPEPASRSGMRLVRPQGSGQSRRVMPGVCPSKGSRTDRVDTVSG